MSRVYLLLVLIFFMGSSIAEDPESQAKQHLNAIEKFLHVAPERSRAVMTNHRESVEHLHNYNKIQWHTAGATIGLKLNDLDLFEQSLKELSKLTTTDNLKTNQTSLLTLLGHFSLMANLLDEAKPAYNCLYALSETPNDKVRAAYRVANAYLSDGDIVNAERIMKELLRVAIKQGNQSWLGPIKSTMGIYALYKKDYLTAETFFSESISMHQERQNYSGEFNSLLNLLLTFLLSDNEKFVRIEHRVTRLSQKNEDTDRNILLKLIQLVRTSKIEKNVEKYQNLAMQYFGQIESSTVKKAAKDFILPELKITPNEPPMNFKSNWVREFMLKLECQAEPTDLGKMLDDLSGF